MGVNLWDPAEPGFWYDDLADFADTWFNGLTPAIAHARGLAERMPGLWSGGAPGELVRARAQYVVDLLTHTQLFVGEASRAFRDFGAVTQVAERAAYQQRLDVEAADSHYREASRGFSGDDPGAVTLARRQLQDAYDRILAANRGTHRTFTNASRDSAEAMARAAGQGVPPTLPGPVDGASIENTMTVDVPGVRQAGTGYGALADEVRAAHATLGLGAPSEEPVRTAFTDLYNAYEERAKSDVRTIRSFGEALPVAAAAYSTGDDDVARTFLDALKDPVTVPGR